MIVVLLIGSSTLNYGMNFYKERAFLEAISGNDCDIAQRFIEENDEYKNYIFNQHETPLHVASRSNNVEMVALLLEKGANPNIADGGGMTPLHYASLHYSEKVVAFLQRKSEMLYCRDNYESIFDKSQKAAFIASFLLQHGAHINAQDKHGNTAVHCAANLGNVDLLRLFIKHDADINKQNMRKETPLHYATIKKTIEINLKKEALALLLEHQADWSIKDESGRTPYDVASPELQEMMRAYAAKKSFAFLYGAKNFESPVSIVPQDLKKEIIQHVIPSKKRCNEEGEMVPKYKRQKI